MTESRWFPQQLNTNWLTERPPDTTGAGVPRIDCLAAPSATIINTTALLRRDYTRCKLWLLAIEIAYPERSRAALKGVERFSRGKTRPEPSQERSPMHHQNRADDGAVVGTPPRPCPSTCCVRRVGANRANWLNPASCPPLDRLRQTALMCPAHPPGNAGRAHSPNG